jgi:hypothetical protein
LGGAVRESHCRSASCVGTPSARSPPFLAGLGPVAKEGDGDGVGQGPVAGRVEVEVVTGVVRRKQPAAVVRVADRAVEVDDGVEPAAGADPPVDRLPRLLADAVRIVVAGAVERGERGAVDAEALGVGAGDDLFVGADEVGRDLLGGRGRRLRRADVVDALEDEQAVDAAPREDVAVQPRRRVRAESAVQDAVAARGLVDDGDAGGALRSGAGAQPVLQLVGPSRSSGSLTAWAPCGTSKPGQPPNVTR